MLDLLMNYYMFLFPLFFIANWMFVVFILSKLGWSKLLKKYSYNKPFIGRRIGFVSAKINLTSYSNVIILKTNDEGFYMKVMFLFRFFHPPVFIPWSEIKNIEEKKVLFFSQIILTLGDPKIATIKFDKKTFLKITKDYKNYNEL